jgi:hypothetical protein
MVINLLVRIHHLAQLRLELAELLLPMGRVLKSNNKALDLSSATYVELEEKYRKRQSDWTIIWDGEDIVHKILHSLDFMKKSHELNSWYGRTYFFIANPLALAFNYETAIEKLNLKEFLCKIFN